MHHRFAGFRPFGGCCVAPRITGRAVCYAHGPADWRSAGNHRLASENKSGTAREQERKEKQMDHGHGRATVMAIQAHDSNTNTAIIMLRYYWKKKAVAKRIEIEQYINTRAQQNTTTGMATLSQTKTSAFTIAYVHAMPCQTNEIIRREKKTKRTDLEKRL